LGFGTKISVFLYHFSLLTKAEATTRVEVLEVAGIHMTHIRVAAEAETLTIQATVATTREAITRTLLVTADTSAVGL
jgi:HSP20 family molecular chaperone IbpA